MKIRLSSTMNSPKQSPKEHHNPKIAIRIGKLPDAPESLLSPLQLRIPLLETKHTQLILLDHFPTELCS